MKRSSFFLALLAWLCGGAFAWAEEAAVTSSEEHAFKAETWIQGLEAPWGMVKLPDGRFLVTERPGRLRIIENGMLQEAPVTGTPEVWARGQGGLLDIELHPHYAENGWIYLSIAKPLEKGALTSIVRGKLKGNAFTELETVFDPPAEEATNAGIHFGSRIEFDAEGYLYFSIGDRGDVLTPENNAQKLGNVKGKIHRLHDDGRVPEDNPFVNTPGARPSIWCQGNRNPQGLRFQPGTGILWETEHGPQGGDELNTIRKGANYGWPVISYGVNYGAEKKPFTDKTEMEGMEQPVTYWTPSIAVCGIDFYSGDAFPKWKGNLFVSALAHNKLVRVVLENGKVAHQEMLLQGQGRIRDVRCFDDGFVYVIYDQPGKIVRLVPAG
jgi:glucose/arabinose dehydrogenase